MMKYSISKSRILELVLMMITPEIVEYWIHEKSGQLGLNNRDGKCVMNYIPRSKELYYDHSLWEYVSKYIPIGYDIDIFKEGVKEYFNSQFPDMLVRSVHGANIC